MKIVIAVDSFKGSLSSIEAGKAIEKGIRRVYLNSEVVIKPLADGGEGTVESLIEEGKGRLRTIKVIGPLGELVNCCYGIIESKTMAVIEMAQVSGLTLVPEAKRNPLYTTTYGLGQVIKDAISQGCRRFIIGIGGSATNDGGIGMLQALGFELLNKDGKPVDFGALGLKKLKIIKTDKVLPVLKECDFMIACDVNNPLCGSLGSSFVYGPQKGADKELVIQMDRWLNRYAILSKKIYPLANADYPGAGAAGGLGFAFLTFLNARLDSGIKLILQEMDFEEDIKDADLVITGEGSLDFQTTMGKAPIGVAKLAKKYNLPVIAFAGSVSNDANMCNDMGIDAYFSILRNIVTLPEAMNKQRAEENMINTVEQVFRLWKIKEDHT
ncbi:glycerate kinase family protein [Thomasclavelia sp.]